MKKVIGVRFRNAGKMYWFSPGEHELQRGEAVIVETSRGKEYGIVVEPPHEVEDDQIVQPIKEILRPASRIDTEQEISNREKERDALATCRRMIREKGLEMKLILAEYMFDNSKILFYFTADGRVDFRELVRDLASIFRTRIELRQVGVRDETKLLGGIGPCGREFCCATWLTDFVPVSIKMAKEQNLSLNSAKISGCCGRLMCCLKNEADTYSYLNAKLPDVNTPVKTPDGTIGKVQSVNVLRQQVRVVIEEQNGNVEIRDFDVSELQFKPSKKKEKRLSQEEEKELKELEG
jgi:cell fate regulator YaaT (PSP1 superfamily)